MNIEQYRALKAQESAPTPTPTVTQQTEPTPTLTQTPAQTETKPIETKPVEETKPALPDKINIEGVGEVTLDELQKGYLRQADYTRKTQEVSRKSKEVEEAVKVYEQLKTNPQLTQQVFQGQAPKSLDPVQSKVVELENKIYDMMLEREIETLQGKYDDFEIKEVLEIAQAKNILNLEDAYLLSKSQKQSTQKPQDLEEVKKQLRQELLKELEQERKATQTIISSSDGVAVVQDNSPKLSEAERKVAGMMKMSDAEYAKWRDAGRVKK